MLNKNDLTNKLNDWFEQLETEKEMMEFNCVLLNFSSAICQAFADEDTDENGESGLETEITADRWEDVAGETYTR
ncbi:MAG: hypothetical protein NC452_11615 [Eubacterium sp.]|nr:hypothetical protein [Eubacterium sp.]